MGVRQQEPSEFLKNLRKRPRVDCDVLNEGTPLPLLVFIRRKCRREGIGRLGRDRRLAPRERSGDRTGEAVIVEAE